MNYDFSYQDDVGAVLLKLAKNQYSGAVNENNYQGSYTVGAAGEVIFRVDGRNVRAFVAKQGSRFLVFLNGRVYDLGDHVEEMAQASAGGGSAEKLVTPPMPGTLVRVLVAQGDAVEEGAPLVVIESMKMESNILAPFAGTVTAIHFAPGDPVQPGDQIVDLSAPEE